MRKSLFASHVDFEHKADPKVVAEAVQKAVEPLEDMELRVLKYVLRHMKRMSDEKGNSNYKIFIHIFRFKLRDIFLNDVSFLIENKMDARNLATVFSPNLVHSESSLTKRPESIMYEMEWNNMLVEKLIVNVDLIFD